MENIDTKNLIYNDTPQVRLFSSETYNWCLDKSTGISCCWGKTAKETPQYDPLGPQEIVWKIKNFDIQKYIEYFDFITNIKIKENNIIKDINKHTLDTTNKICLSPFGNLILVIDTDTTNFNIDELKEFLNYIKFFNIEPKIELVYSLDIIENMKKYISIISNIIITTKCNFDYNNIEKCINIAKDNNINISFKINVNKNTKVDVNTLINKIDKQISVIFYFSEPYLSTRTYLDIQSKCMQKQLTNICIAQCSKRHYSKDVIGSIIIELACSYCKYSIYIEDNEVYDCEKKKIKIGKLEEFNTIHDFWYASSVVNKRKSLIDKNKC